mmetsp:Transcript_27212/g.97247  ORF Transcript_27212/g.97247 Transcript_27212/m.97247 type:complete len:232 (-) Transcript_27212:6829-7524(-)
MSRGSAGRPHPLPTRRRPLRRGPPFPRRPPPSPRRRPRARARRRGCGGSSSPRRATFWSSSRPCGRRGLSRRWRTSRWFGPSRKSSSSPSGCGRVESTTKARPTSSRSRRSTAAASRSPWAPKAASTSRSRTIRRRPQGFRALERCGRRKARWRLVAGRTWLFAFPHPRAARSETSRRRRALDFETLSRAGAGRRWRMPVARNRHLSSGWMGSLTKVAPRPHQGSATAHTL